MLMKIGAIFMVVSFSLTYLAIMGYILGYFVLLPTLKKKLKKKLEKEATMIFDNFLYPESALKELIDSKDPAVLSLRRLTQFSEYAFVINFILLLLFFSIS